MQVRNALGWLCVVTLLAALAGQGCSLDSEGSFPADSSASGQATGTAQGGAGGMTTSGTTSGGNGGTASGGNGGSGGGTGGCMPTTEDCLNSIDDDCDGMTDCEDSDCGNFVCQPLPDGATFVTTEQQQCGTGLTALAADSCDGCSCSVDGVGTCTHQAVLYDNANCMGAQNERKNVQVNGCTSANTMAASNDTVGAIANAVGVGDAQCSADNNSATVRDTSLCQLPAAGSCVTAGQACVPQARGLDCVMLSGDVACDAPYTNKQLYFADSNASSCNCSCGGGPQKCPTDAHYHAYANGGCNSTKFDVLGDGACHDTMLAAVNSLQNHSAFDATGASCDNNSAPSGNPAAMTVCCTP